MPVIPDILGVILAGGTARRMYPDAQGGGDKGLINIWGRPMLAHVLDGLAPQVTRVILNANGPAARFSSFGLDVVADLGPGDQGPLAGISAAFDWSDRHTPTITAVLSVSSDTPFLPRDLAKRLFTASDEGKKVAVAASSARWHPVIALWPRGLAADLKDYLATGGRSADVFAKRHGAIAVPFPQHEAGGHSIDPFFNINTPDDAERAGQWRAAFEAT